MKKFYYDSYKKCYIYKGYFFYYFRKLKKWYVSTPDGLYPFNSKDNCFKFIDFLNYLDGGENNE